MNETESEKAEEVKEEAKQETKTVEATAEETADAEEVEEVEVIPAENAFQFAIVRMPSPTLTDGITTSDLGRADYAIFLQQHLSYTAVLRSLGLEIIKLPSLPDFPDAHFVEDVAIITPEVAIITRPGAGSRLGEIEHIRETISELRPVVEIEEPGTIDGGDVLRIEQTVFVGLSERTNKRGADQLGAILKPLGYEVHNVKTKDGLHLKSDVNYIGHNTLLLLEKWANHKQFASYDKIIVPEEEAYVANTLLVNDRLLTPSGFPRTHAALREAGFDLLEISTSEIQKMDGGLTCLSIRFD